MTIAFTLKVSNEKWNIKNLINNIKIKSEWFLNIVVDVSFVKPNDLSNYLHANYFLYIPT